MPHIVVADSLAADGHKLAEHAIRIGRSMGAELRLLHVLPELMPPPLGEGRRRRAQERLMAATARLTRRTGSRVSYKVTQGDVCGRILRESEDLEAVLTVIGHTPDRSGLLRLPGGTALRCVERARNAVLLVRGETQENGYRRALVASDPAVDEDRLLPYLPHLAPHAALHGFAMRPVRKAGEQVAAMRRALDADLLVIGVPPDESLNPFRFRRLPAMLARRPECDTLFVPWTVATAPPAAETAMRIRAAV